MAEHLEELVDELTPEELEQRVDEMIETIVSPIMAEIGDMMEFIQGKTQTITCTAKDVREFQELYLEKNIQTVSSCSNVNHDNICDCKTFVVTRV